MKREVLIFFPGFPGEAYERSPGEKRVIDQVCTISTGKNYVFSTIQYPGIKDQKKFSFLSALQESFNELERYSGNNITLVGQSFGGLLAILVSRKFKVKKTLLITPFIVRPTDDEVKDLLKFYSNEFPAMIEKNRLSEYFDEISTLFNSLVHGEKKLRKPCGHRWQKR